MTRFALAIHGGAGRVGRELAGEREMREALRTCLERGRAALAGGAPALDVVERCVRDLESHPSFNAGRGSALTAGGGVEMDASIMDGRTAAAGAVACVTRVAHPVSLARAVMERTGHVLLVGEAADDFARGAGLEPAEPAALVTPERRDQLERARSRGQVSLDHDAAGDGGGTVGAVALDSGGHLAAATSTGGLTGQLPGRVGDSAVIGAGTWADDRTCAVSATGDGEIFIRTAVAHEIDAGMRLGGLGLAGACERALARATALGGRGGLVAVDRDGALALPFTTRGMYRGWFGPGSEPRIAIFADE